MRSDADHGDEPAVGFLAVPGPVALAHRGFAPDGAENSMAAFQAAVDLGYRYLETDVRVSRDAVAFAFHDRVLDRVTDRRGALASLTAAQIEQARICGREPIPRLDEVLGAWPQVRVNIDVKSDAAMAPTVAAIERAGAAERVCVAAFSDARLRRVRAMLGPEVCSALGPGEMVRLKLLSRTRRARPPGEWSGRCAQIPVGFGRLRLLDAPLLRTAHEAGLVVHVWTVNNTATMGDLLDLGVDGIITDRAADLRTVLRGRGQWSPG